MKMSKWTTDKLDPMGQYKVVLFISRNKDNKDVPDFKERKRSFFCQENPEKILKQFDSFVEEGVPGETSRLYVSNNARDPKEVRRDLLVELIQEDEINFNAIEAMIAGIAARKENAAEMKWLFDFDIPDEDKVKEFTWDILDKDPTVTVEYSATPNGYAVITSHGFDTRALFEKWSPNFVTLKRDDMVLKKWQMKRRKFQIIDLEGNVCE